LRELQNHLFAVVQLEDHALEVQEDIDDILLNAVNRRVLVQDAVDAHLGRRIARHRREQNPPQRIAQSMPVTAFKRFHDHPCMHRRQALHIDDARFK
jgi:hypothetical protein